MAYHYRHSICNEVYEKWDFAAACASIKKAGYDGIEIAPFTLHEYPATIPPAQRNEYRRIIADAGLEFVGLHWLMVSPKGLHVTTPDAALRAQSWRHIRDLVDLCADLAGNRADDNGGRGGSSPKDSASRNGIMVFGSPKQRTSTGGITPAEATRHFVDGLAGVTPHAEQRGVTILVEALPKADSDIINTVAAAAEIVREIGSPNVRTMFDTHNAADETEPHAAVLERYFDLIRHIHINEMDGRHPGAGDYDFRPIFETLARRNYSGWVSLEVFDFSAGAEAIANDSLRYVEKVLSGMTT